MILDLQFLTTIFLSLGLHVMKKKKPQWRLKILQKLSRKMKYPSTYSKKRLIAKNIDQGLRLENVNYDLNYDFPFVNQRKLQNKWQTYQKREWLVYSKKKDSAYWFHCLLFGPPYQHSVWSSENGYQGWKKGYSLWDIEIAWNIKKHIGCWITRLCSGLLGSMYQCPFLKKKM